MSAPAPSPAEITARVQAAVQARAALGLDAVRLVDGAGDGLPRLVVERFGDAYWVRGGPERAADLPAVRAGLGDPPALFWRFGHSESGGPPDDPGARIIDEHGLRFEVDLGNTRNTGLFLDGRPARAWVRAHSDGAAILNLFSYTCAFGVAAAAGGARLTANIDTSAGVLARGRAHYALNGLPHDGRTFWKRDAIKALRQLRSARARYDGVVIDPPPVRHGGAPNADPLAYLTRVCRLAREVLAPGGWLLVLSATRGADADALQAAAGLGDPVWVGGPGDDFRPVPGGHRLHAAAFRQPAG